MRTLGMRWYEEGVKEGEYERAKKVAKNMLMRGLDIKLISEVTGLSEEEVKRIKEEVKEEIKNN